MLEAGTLIEKYEVLELLGEGGMASVYKVRHQHLGSLHALKVLRPELVARRDIRDRFLDEGRIQAQMRHPNIVPVTDIVAAPGVAGLVGQFVDGPSLDIWIEAATELPDLADVKDIFLPVLAGLGYAHEQGVVHRDIKPANILLARARHTAPGDSLSARFVPMLLDFGIARVRGVLEGADDRKKTRAGARMGTLEYMSPEQIHGEPDLDQRADIFALSASIYEFVTGSAPFASDSEYDTMRKIVQGDTDPVRDIAPQTDPMLEAFIRKGLATDRERRFASCKEMAEALKQLGSKRSGSFLTDEDREEFALGAAPSEPEPSEPEPEPGPVPPPAAAHRPSAPVPPSPLAISPPARALTGQSPAEALIQPPPAIPGIVAALLNFFCLPGLGQMILGQGSKGVALLFGSFVVAVCSGGASLIFSQALIALDAYAIAGKLKRGQPVGRWEWF
jgi:serine/threonine-protein kinase